MIETAEWLQAFVKCTFPRMAEWRVADVVGQRDGLGKVLVQSQSPRNCSRDLRDFECVCQPGAVVVVDGGDEHLRLAGHAAEGGAVDDAFAIALIERAEGVIGFRVPSPAREARGHCIRGEVVALVVHALGSPVNSSLNRSYSASSDCEMTLVSATTGMKLVSPCQRGTMCQCR